MADYYLHKTAAHIDELFEKVEGLNNYDDTEVRGLINNKVDKETGKGLSTNDFTTEEKTKLAGIESGAQVNVQADWNQTTTTADDYIKNKPAIPDAQIQSDWNQTNTESKDFIKNKPTIPPVQVNADWNAESGVAQILNKPTLGSAAFKNYTSSVTSDSNDLVMSGAVYSAISTKADLENGKVPSSQLPSYVDDVLEYASTSAFPETGESGKIYISTDTNKTYRWGGSAYVEISESLALGETASTAYAGNKGKANADAIAAIKDGTNIDSFADVETALAAKLNTADVDTALSDTSTNPVQNKAIQAPLAMLIDNGAKNLAKFDIWAKQCSLVRGTKTINGNGSITITATSSDCYTLFSPTEFPVECRIPVTPGTEMVATWEEAETGTGNKYIYFFPNGSTSGLISVKASDEVKTFTVPADCEYLTWRIGCSTSGDTVTFNNLMICSAADYAVSSAYVLYAPTNRELYNDINVLNQRIESFVYNPNTSKSIILTGASSATFLALGYVQGIGNIYWILEIDGSGNLTVKNGFDGSTVSAAGISFNKDTKTLTFTSSYNGNSNITIIMTSV